MKDRVQVKERVRTPHNTLAEEYPYSAQSGRIESCECPHSCTDLDKHLFFFGVINSDPFIWALYLFDE